MPIKVINLPCKANELAETIRCFCEHNGSFDTCVVNPFTASTQASGW